MFRSLQSHSRTRGLLMFACLAAASPALGQISRTVTTWDLNEQERTLISPNNPPAWDRNPVVLVPGIGTGAAADVWFTISNPLPALGRLVYNAPSNNLTIYRVAKSVSDGGGRSEGIAINRTTGDVWMTNQGSPPLAIFIASSGKFRRFGSLYVGQSLQGITLDAQGNAWIAEPSFPGGGAILKVTPTGQFTRWPLGNSVNPQYVLVDGSGNVWFTENYGNAIGRLNPSAPTTTNLKEWLLPSTPGFRFPLGITRAPNGDIWFVEQGNFGVAGTARIGQLFRSPTATDFDFLNEFLPAAGLGLPEFIEVDNYNRVFFTERDVNRLSVLTPANSVPAAGFPLPAATQTRGITPGTGAFGIIGGADVFVEMTTLTPKTQSNQVSPTFDFGFELLTLPAFSPLVPLPSGQLCGAAPEPVGIGLLQPLSVGDPTTAFAVESFFNDLNSCPLGGIARVSYPGPLTMASCPSNINIFNATGPVSVALPPADVKGGEPPVVVSCSRSDGKPCVPGTTPSDPFPVGSTTVTYTAIDALGKTVTCSFLVNVSTGPPPPPPPPAITFTKTVTESSATCGGQLHYQIPFSNSGSVTLTNASIVDRLPAATKLNGTPTGTLSGNPIPSSSFTYNGTTHVLTIALGSLAAGAGGTINVTLDLNTCSSSSGQKFGSNEANFPASSTFDTTITSSTIPTTPTPSPGIPPLFDKNGNVAAQQAALLAAYDAFTNAALEVFLISTGQPAGFPPRTSSAYIKQDTGSFFFALGVDMSVKNSLDESDFASFTLKLSDGTTKTISVPYKTDILSPSLHSSQTSSYTYFDPEGQNGLKSNFDITQRYPIRYLAILPKSALGTKTITGFQTKVHHSPPQSFPIYENAARFLSDQLKTVAKTQTAVPLP